MPRIPATAQKPQPEPIAAAQPAAPIRRPPEVIELKIETIRVEVPLGTLGTGYRSSHVEAKLKPPQAETMQRLVVALRDQRAVTLEGREVRTPADAVRWLLDRIAAA